MTSSINKPIDVNLNEAAVQGARIERAEHTADNCHHQFTSAHVQSDCPSLLQNLGLRISAHLDKAQKYEEKAEQHFAAVGQLLTQAQDLCDEGGFVAFREKFCPHLGKSRAYELLAIAANKKSVQQIKAETRERVARHRANKARSVTVTDKVRAGSLGQGTTNSASTVADNKTEPLAKPSRPDGQVDEPRDWPDPQAFAELNNEWQNAVGFRRAVANAPVDVRDKFHAEVVRAYRD